MTSRLHIGLYATTCSKCKLIVHRVAAAGAESAIYDCRTLDLCSAVFVRDAVDLPEGGRREERARAERETEERGSAHQNEAPLDLPSDHPLRKLISRFRRRSERNLMSPVANHGAGDPEVGLAYHNSEPEMEIADCGPKPEAEMTDTEVGLADSASSRVSPPKDDHVTTSNDVAHLNDVTSHLRDVTTHLHDAELSLVQQ